jgi:hypothetical protein
LDSVTTTLLFVAVLVLLLVLGIGIQFVRTRRAPLGRAVAILEAIKHNEEQCRRLSQSLAVSRLRDGAWTKHRDRLKFLPEELHAELVNLFDDIAAANQSYDAARRLGSDSYIETDRFARLAAPLASCREQLQRWVEANMYNPAYLPKKYTIFHR